MLLKYLFPVVETNYLVLKNIIKKIICEHSQVWSCHQKDSGQFKFNFDARFNSYRFFCFGFACMWGRHDGCPLLHACFPLLCVVYMYERYITGLMSDQVIVGGY